MLTDVIATFSKVTSADCTGGRGPGINQLFLYYTCEQTKHVTKLLHKMYNWKVRRDSTVYSCTINHCSVF